MKKTYVIGDTHGCYNEFSMLMKKIQPDLSRDKLVMLGDYIDRGYQSCEMVNSIVELQQEYGKDHVVLLRGNHEQMAIDYYKRNSGSFLYNGCDTTFMSFKRNNDSLENYIGFFESLPLYHEDSFFIYVHAGLRPGKTLEEQSQNDLLWIRDKFIFSSSTTSKTVIFGHTPTKFINNSLSPLMINNRYAIDTGCVYSGNLSAIEIDNNRILRATQVKKESAA